MMKSDFPVPYPKARLREIIEGVENLPTLPVVAVKIIELIENPSSSAEELSKLISLDQVLTFEILKLVNSSYYSVPEKISTVKLALTILGFDALKELALSVSFLVMFSESKGDEFCHKDFWEHSIGCGTAAKVVARDVNYRVTGEAFVGGLIHDIGKVVIGRVFPKKLVEIQRKCKVEKISIFEAEDKVLGVTHAEIGSWLTEKWNLPAGLAEAVSYHHSPKDSKENPSLTAIVHLGNILCRMKNIGWGGDDKIPLVDNYAWSTLKKMKPDLNETDIEKFLYDLDGELKEIEGIFAEFLS